MVLGDRRRHDHLDRGLAAVGDEDVVTTWITAGELFYGAARSEAPDRNAVRVSTFLATLDVLGLDLASAAHFGHAKASAFRAS